MKLIVFDLETTGVEPVEWRFVEGKGWQRKDHQIAEIAALAVEVEQGPDGTTRMREVDEFHQRLKFDTRLAGDGVLELIGYTNDEEWGGVAPVLAFARFDSFLRSHADVERVSKAGKPYKLARGCAYNAPFDTGFLKECYGRTKRFLPMTFLAFDALQLAMWDSLRCHLSPESFKLEKVAERLGIAAPERYHSALEDVRITARVIANSLRWEYMPRPCNLELLT